MIARAAPVMAALLLCAPAALAQPAAPPDRTEARYEEALVDLDEGRFKAACPKLEAVVAAAPDRLIAHYKLGGCYLALGKLASAWSRFVLVRDRAKKAGNAQQASIAANSASRIEKKLARLTVIVPPAVARTPGLAVLCDGAPLAPADLGKARPVDRGDHHVEVRAPGKATWARTVLVDADGKSFSVTLEPLAPDVAAPPPAAPASRPWQRPAAFVAGGLGLAGVAAGAASFALALQKNDESLRDCRPDNHCNETGFRARNDARMFGDASTAALVAGGALLSAGVVLFATAPRARDTDPRPGGAGAAGARIEIGLGHLTVTGSW